MKHFSARDWIELARGATAPETALGMQRHLKEGCTTCAAVSRLWQRVAGAAARDAAYEPPGDSVRIAKSLFRVRAPGFAPKAARLLFDSLREPLPSGVRSQTATARQLLFEQGRFQVDARLESGPVAGRISLIGQIVKQPAEDGGTRQELAHISVLLLEGERVMSIAHTNRFGEFHLEFEETEDLRLWIAISSKSPILIQLPGPDAPGERELVMA